MAAQHDNEAVSAFIGAEAKAAIVRSQSGSDRWERKLAEGVQILDAANQDYRYAVHSAWSDPAFNVGLALGIYLALNGGRRSSCNGAG